MTAVPLGRRASVWATAGATADTVAAAGRAAAQTAAAASSQTRQASELPAACGYDQPPHVP
eukprot:3632922-Alexandrium_andersonii.AAC.1